nr:carboxylesterase family protein [Lachnospiraceae bacterium]
IVLMGQSAGAMSITDLLSTDLLKGLVSGAVMMSGAGAMPEIVGPYTEEKAKPFWDKVRERLGAKDNDALKGVPAKELWEAWYAQSREDNNFHYLQPGIDGKIIKESQARSLRKGYTLNIPMIVGVTSQDFLSVVIYEIALHYALKLSKQGHAPVWGYFFDRELPGNSYKAFHSSDLWYMFGNMDKSWRPFTEEDKALAAEMTDYVANFVKSGNPNGSGLPLWEPVSKKNKKFRWFDVGNKWMISPHLCRKKERHTWFKDKGPM